MKYLIATALITVAVLTTGLFTIGAYITLYVLIKMGLKGGEYYA